MFRRPGAEPTPIDRQVVVFVIDGGQVLLVRPQDGKETDWRAPTWPLRSWVLPSWTTRRRLRTELGLYVHRRALGRLHYEHVEGEFAYETTYYVLEHPRHGLRPARRWTASWFSLEGLPGGIDPQVAELLNRVDELQERRA